MSDDSRKKANEDLIRRMKAGESLNLVPASATWFPPRQVIKKNKKLMGKLYKCDHDKVVDGICEVCDEEVADS